MRKILIKGTISEVIQVLQDLRDDVFEVLEECIIDELKDYLDKYDGFSRRW